MMFYSTKATKNFFFTIFFFSILLTNKSHAAKTQLYSETVYDSRFDGAITDSRLRFFPLNPNRLNPFLGLNFSRDLSNGNAPAFTINSVAPSLGLNVKIHKYLFLSTEYRRLITDQEIKKDEFRLGAYTYHFYNFNKKAENFFFNEIYAESFYVNRVANQPYFVIFDKIGFRQNIIKPLKVDYFIEGYSKTSPDLGYGPSEHELRLGIRPRISIYNKLHILLSLTYAPLSNTNTDGFDAMAVLSGEF